MEITKELEAILKNKLDFIRSKINVVEKSRDNVWGKEIRRLLPNGEVEQEELETFYFTLQLINYETIEQLLTEFVNGAIKIENTAAQKVDSNIANVICYQLIDWIFLQRDNGSIISEISGFNQITLVMYGKFMKKLGE